MSVLNNDNPAYLYVACVGAKSIAMPLEENNSLFVGSGSNCSIVLQGNGVEPIHCMFWMNEKGVVRVQDWNTEIGVTVNGQLATAETILSSGDELNVGGNRIVPVLSREVDQRIAPLLALDELVASNPEATTDNDSSSNESSSVESASIESAIQPPEVLDQPNEPELALATEADPPSLPIEQKVVVREVPEQESTGYQYDVMADLDSVDITEDEIAVDFGSETMGIGDAAGLDEARQEEVELLRMEVDQLRFELAERDSQRKPSEEPAWTNDPVSDEGDQTVQLVNRLEDLLEELQASDGRVRGLEDLLRASDQATQAERDERLQLESWVTEIEQRVAERESEAEAELSRLKNRLDETTSRHKQTQIQLKKVLQSKNVGQEVAANDLIPKFHEQIEELEKRLEMATMENDQLRDQSVGDVNEAASQESLRQMEQKLLQQQVDSSRERAEQSRQRAELEQLKGELEEKLTSVKSSGNGDARLAAMRQHLREIHEEEKIEREEKRQRSLGGRISRLLGAAGR